MTPREEIVGVIEVVPRERVVLATRLDGAACTTVVLAYPVKLELDAVIREGMVGQGGLDGVPAAVVAVLGGVRREVVVAAGVYRFALEGLVPLAGAFGNAYVTVRGDSGDATIAVPDAEVGHENGNETIFVADEAPQAATPVAAVLTRPRLALLAILFVVAALVAYGLVGALLS